MKCDRVALLAEGSPQDGTGHRREEGTLRALPNAEGMFQNTD